MTDPSYQAQILEIQAENELMRLLGTRVGFFDYYFKELGKTENGQTKHRTNYECFNHVNDTYFELFGEYRYITYDSFRRSYKFYLQNK